MTSWRCFVMVLPLFFVAAAHAPGTPAAAPFQHPGILHSRADLERIRRHVAAGGEPWRTAFEQFSANEWSRSDYHIEGGFEAVTRDPQVNVHNTELWHDCNAAYQNALMWAITGDEAHAA